MKKFLATVLIASCVSTVVSAEDSAQPEHKITMQERMRERFLEVDKNHDAVLTIDEIKENHAARFAKLDADANGRVSKEEFVVLSTKEDEKVHNEQFQKMLASLRAIKAKGFEKMDTDHNQELLQDEFMVNAETFFKDIDLNQDGQITIDEWDQQSKRK